jgi:methionyl aminopeptidase
MYDFPNTLNWSPNSQVVHGIPNNESLKEGDVISVDCGALKNGFYGDHAYTFEVGEVAEETKKLLKVTKESLYVGIREFKEGNRVGDVGYAIQKYCEDHGYGVVRELVGHGLGKDLHEDPQMPNYGKRGRGKKFVNGMVVAIEPMINMGTRRIKQLNDGWTILTADNKPSAHFEHDVALIDGKPELLSTFQYIYDALGISSDEEEEFRAKKLQL